MRNPLVVALGAIAVLLLLLVVLHGNQKPRTETIDQLLSLIHI